MKYKVGDYVRVKEDLELGKQYGNDKFVSSMSGYRGKVYQISNVFPEKGVYLLKDFHYDVVLRDNAYWNWKFTDEMLEPIDFKYKVGDIVGVKENLVPFTQYGNVIFVDDMEKYCGNTFIVRECENRLGRKVYYLRHINGQELSDYYFSEEMLETVDNKTKHVNVLQGDVPIKTIIGNNNTIVTMLKDNGGKVIARGKAKCMAEDTFNLPFGVLLSMLRCFKHYGKYLNAEQYGLIANEVIDAFDYENEYKLVFEDAPEKEYTMDFKEEPTENSCDK